MLLSNKAKEEFQIEPIVSSEVDELVAYCVRAYRGTPDWVDSKEHIKTMKP